MTSIFITGATGYIGSYVAQGLLDRSDERLALLVRAKSRDEAVAKLWRAWQPHLDAPKFWDALDRVDFFFGDLTAPGLGLDGESRERLVKQASSVLHIAASLNRKSAKACFNANLRGTLSVVKLARAIADTNGLRRFSHVSTTAVAGKRAHETVEEDAAIDWDRSDYDPYARTKKFAEHMVRELLPDTSLTFFRPSTVLGDSRRDFTGAFDMARAFTFLADLPVIPMDGSGRQDIANVDWVSKAITHLHLKEAPRHDIYHLSAGEASPTAKQISDTINDTLGRRRSRFVAGLAEPFETAVDLAALAPGKNPVTLTVALLKVFWPYLTFDTVFSNRRAVEEVGEAPVPFIDYCVPLYQWVKKHGFAYPHEPLPERAAQVQVQAEAR